MLGMGSLVSLLLVLLAVLTVYLRGKNAAIEAELLRLSDEVERIERAQETIRQLEQDIIQAEHLVVERTEVARMIEHVGRLVSENLWLDVAELAEGTPEAAHLTLTGAALDEGALAAYLNRLEQAPFARNVRLGVSERIHSARLYRQATVQDRVLTRFEIQLDVSAAVQPAPETTP